MAVAGTSSALHQIRQHLRSPSKAVGSQSGLSRQRKHIFMTIHRARNHAERMSSLGMHYESLRRATVGSALNMLAQKVNALVDGSWNATCFLPRVQQASGKSVTRRSCEGPSWVGIGLSRSPLNFQSGNLLCLLDRPKSARSGHCQRNEWLHKQ